MDKKHSPISPFRSLLGIASLAVELMFMMVAVGCGPTGPRQVQVNGKVTFGGNPPAADGCVYFSPLRPAEGFKARGGRGDFKKGDGTFTVQSVRPNDGLMPGVYSARIVFQQPPANFAGIPKGFEPPELEIKIGDTGSVTYLIEVPSSP